MRKDFRQRVRQAIANPVLQRALDQNADRRQKGRRQAMASLPDVHGLRQQARFIRRETLENLPRYLEQFATKAAANGIQIHRAANAEEARRLIVNIAKRHGAGIVVKSKSMVSEEIELNQALKAAGIRPVETDLGELIVQLRDERPTHIITPAIHLLKEDVAKVFASKLGMPYTTDVSEMTATARRVLRDVFIKARVGVSGVNFGVAETGTLCLVTNEGNGRMVTTLPPVHIALMGVERLVPTLGDLATMLQLLPRSATGQKLTSYVTLIHGPRAEGDPDGPEERHLILIDNGRFALSESPLSESLMCIRCGACLNACPVFRELGGHPYDSVYPGPIGSVISPGLFGMAKFGHLAKASTLCGACTDVCPVGIEFTTLLLRVRDDYVKIGSGGKFARFAMRLYARVMEVPNLLGWAQRIAAILSSFLPKKDGWIRRLPPPISGWASSRDFPPFASKPFRARLRSLSVVGTPHTPDLEPQAETFPLPEALPMGDPVARFKRELEASGGEFIRCTEERVPDLVAARLHELGVHYVISWGELEPVLYAVLHRLEWEGFKVEQPEIPRGNEGMRKDALDRFGKADVGLTGSLAGIAETGSVVVPGGRRKSTLASLMPGTHLVLLDAKAVYHSFDDLLQSGSTRTITGASSLALITGPSRTADVEMSLTIGVHGPAKVIVFCVE